MSIKFRQKNKRGTARNYGCVLCIHKGLTYVFTVNVYVIRKAQRKNNSFTTMKNSKKLQSKQII